MGRGLDLILSGRIVEAEEALAMGLLTEVVAPGKHLERALEMAEGLAAFPQETMLADRRAAIEGMGLPLDEGLALEARYGSEVAGTESPVPPVSPPARAAAARAPGSSPGPPSAWPPPRRCRTRPAPAGRPRASTRPRPSA